MDTAGRGERYSRFSPQSRRYIKPPGNRGVGVTQNQATFEWDVHERVLWELEHAGKLTAIRLGNRVYFSRAQLTELLGEPKHRTTPPALKHRDNGSDAKGGQQERFPFESESVAA